MKDGELHVVAYDLREGTYVIPTGHEGRMCEAAE
jgi:hypothetical protein